jgi:hypothetical protein
MATSKETIYTHTCDLCGSVRDEAELAHLWNGEQMSRNVRRADICPDCRSRPVSEVLGFLATRAPGEVEIMARIEQLTERSEPKTVRVKVG